MVKGTDLDHSREWDEHYQITDHPILEEIERRVHGTDYGINSFTTKDQADELVTQLRLGPGTKLLDLGSGSGWPGLYLARQSGSDVVLCDLPLAGMYRARDRAERDGISGQCGFVVGSGARLPLRPGTFDAVSHADVLC